MAARMDEAFLPLHELLPLLLPELPELVDDEAGVRMHAVGVDLETPVELDIVVDERGGVSVGGVPPLYPLETTWRPVFHQIRLVTLRAEVER